MDTNNTLFQQDGLTADTARTSANYEDRPPNSAWQTDVQWYFWLSEENNEKNYLTPNFPSTPLDFTADSGTVEDPNNLWKTDDGDSGNDEPTDYYGLERRQSQQQIPAAPPPQRPPVPPVASSPPLDRVAEQLDLLSSPREPDDIVPGLVECLPPEVLLVVFSNLDDISLWSVGNVCKRWRQMLHTYVTPEQWRLYTNKRWPLFRPLCIMQDWFKVYTKLIDSCPCKVCLQQMALQLQPPGEENSWRRNRLRNELKGLRTDPPEGIEAVPLDPKCCHWQATITGPVGSPYEGGLFYLYIQVPYSYPMCPPIVRFLTRIFHPNVSRHGDVGIDSIHHNWSLALTISKVLISVQSLLTDPYCEVCMEPEVGELYLNDRDTFEDVARTWTWRYAMHDALGPILTEILKK
uniref:E2 ubiquitin-conjugating enzyme n=1 Tax=Timema tahoe TaxID=61484 RepID=A0A7R9FNJ5_9NEOP|nr:unnamed protein product [Timema tahoe]